MVLQTILCKLCDILCIRKCSNLERSIESLLRHVRVRHDHVTTLLIYKKARRFSKLYLLSPRISVRYESTFWEFTFFFVSEIVEEIMQLIYMILSYKIFEGIWGGISGMSVSAHHCYLPPTPGSLHEFPC